MLAIPPPVPTDISVIFLSSVASRGSTNPVTTYAVVIFGLITYEYGFVASIAENV